MASSIRAMPENEKPPAVRVDIYCVCDDPKSGIAFLVIMLSPTVCDILLVFVLQALLFPAWNPRALNTYVIILRSHRSKTALKYSLCTWSKKISYVYSVTSVTHFSLYVFAWKPRSRTFSAFFLLFLKYAPFQMASFYYFICLPGRGHIISDVTAPFLCAYTKWSLFYEQEYCGN